MLTVPGFATSQFRSGEVYQRAMYIDIYIYFFPLILFIFFFFSRKYDLFNTSVFLSHLTKKGVLKYSQLFLVPLGLALSVRLREVSVL